MNRCSRWLLVGFVGVLALAPWAVQAQGLLVKPGSRVAVVGDSITEQKQYSRNIEMYLMICLPELKAHVMQFGWSGETAGGFVRRLNNDLLPFNPNLVTTCYGMNDGRYTAFTPDIGKGYEVPMRDIVDRLKKAGVTVLVGSPGAVDTKTFRKDPAQAKVYNENLAQLRDIAKKAAAEAGMPFANVHDALIGSMAKAKEALGENYDVCGGDGVHPGANGHLVMAYAFLKGMGCDGDLGSIAIDLKGQSSAANGHKVLSSAGGKVEVESSRYPFCFFGDEKSSGSTRSILPFVPFNQDLNRLTLVVKNLDAARAKVTWGKASKEFAKADLEKGINLAAEFLDNPFCPEFQRVEALVRQKQEFETMMIKSFITNFPSLTRNLGEDAEAKAALETLRTRLWATEDKHHATVLAAVKPVKHTILVEALP